MIYPYLIELWMLYVFMVPYALCMSSVYPLISSNITKAVGPAKQGTVSGWTTNIQSISQSISPLIAASFLQIGGLYISFIFISSYQLIGLTNVLLSITLFLIAYFDVKKHPKLYAYEILMRQKEAERKERLITESEST